MFNCSSCGTLPDELCSTFFLVLASVFRVWIGTVSLGCRTLTFSIQSPWDGMSQEKSIMTRHITYILSCIEF